MINNVHFNKPYMTGKELFYIAQAHFNGRLAGDGPFTKLCHQRLEDLSGCHKVLLTHSCTAALEMQALLLNIQPGDEIIMPRNTMMVIHNAWMFTYGNAAELRKAADDLDKLNNVGKGAYLEKAGDKLNETTLSAMMDTETWLTAEECIRLGLADRFAEGNADMSNAASILQKKNLNVQQRIEIQKSLLMQLKQFTEPSIGEGDGDPKNTDPQGKGKDEQKEEPVNIMQMLSGFFYTEKEE